MRKLLVLLLLLPVAELFFLIEIGKRIGTLPTLALLAGTAIAGVVLARRQGLEALREAQDAVRRGRFPAASIVDGIMLLVAGALFVTPGVITDAMALVILVPAVRARVKRSLWTRFRRAVEENRVHVQVGGIGYPWSDPRMEPFERDETPRYKIH